MLQKKIKIVLWENIVRESWIIYMHELKICICDKIRYPTGSYCSKSTRETSEQCVKYAQSSR